MSLTKDQIRELKKFPFNRKMVKCGHCRKRVNVLNAGYDSITGYTCEKCYKNKETK